MLKRGIKQRKFYIVVMEIKSLYNINIRDFKSLSLQLQQSGNLLEVNEFEKRLIHVIMLAAKVIKSIFARQEGVENDMQALYRHVVISEWCLSLSLSSI